MWLLLKNGAIINGTNALQLAATHGKLGTVRLLVEASADVNGMLVIDDRYHGRHDVLKEQPCIMLLSRSGRGYRMSIGKCCGY